MFRRAIKITIWTITGLYFAIVILLHIPSIQNVIGECAAGFLSKKLGTEVSIGRVDLGFANRIIIDDSRLLDQKGKPMLGVSRISVKISLLALANGRIEITSAQLFGLNANLYKTTPEAKPNFQFVVDSLASKDTTKQKTPIDLQINSLIIRNSAVRYRVLSRATGEPKFSTNNIDVRNLSAHLIVNRITNDSANIKVKRLSFNERCGFALKKLSLNAVVSRNGAQVERLRLELPETIVESDHISATYKTKGDAPEWSSLRFEGSIKAPRITPRDLSCFVPRLKNLDLPLTFSIGFNGTLKLLNIKELRIASTDNSLVLNAQAQAFRSKHTTWQAEISRLYASNRSIASVFKSITGNDQPSIINRLGDVSATCKASGEGTDVHLNGTIGCAMGSIKLSAAKQNEALQANVETHDFALGKLLDTQSLGNISLNLEAKGKSKDNIGITGSIYNATYNGYAFRNIDINADYINKVLNGKIAIDDPNLRASIDGMFEHGGATPHLQLATNVETLAPSALKISNKWRDATFSGNIVCDIRGTNVNNADGQIDINDFTMQRADSTYSIRNINITTGDNAGNHFLNLKSDFGTVDINGHFSYNTVTRSVLNLIADKLPTIPGLEKKPIDEHNDFTINASIHDTKWLETLLGIPLEIHRPLNLSGEIDDRRNDIDLWCDVPSFSYNGARYDDTRINIESLADTLKADIRIKKISAKGKALSLKLRAGAADNRLQTSIEFCNEARRTMKGVMNASTVFAKNEEGESTAYVDILESNATIGDTTWHIRPSRVTYYKNHLNVDDFYISHANQSVSIDGTATNNTTDSLTVRLKNVDVNYVLDLINFHSVEFYGKASGTAYVAGIFGKAPFLNSDLQVDDFKFEDGRMGTLFANIGYNDEKGRIEFDAVSRDDDRNTIINGYVSPRHNYIDLGIKAEGTRAEFLSGFCDSFMDNIDARIDGNINVVGPLNAINLVGKAKVDGSVRITSLNTTYWLRGDSVLFVPGEIKFCTDTIYDRAGNIGIVTGGLHHNHFSNWSYDIGIEAQNLLSYDTHTFDGMSFYGTAYTTGTCNIVGRSGEVTIDVNATPERNSILVYNAGDNGSLSSQDYIQWRTHEDDATTEDNEQKSTNHVNIGTNIKLNFLVNCTPDATLKVLMDDRTGDYIRLNGEGVLRATYFNKGTFDLYGNYFVESGTYKLTIQNIIKKDFEFQKGGTISFGGDPYNAALDLRALYVLNSVSLADLNIGNSFSNNNVRVNCLMNITGTPETPKVAFSLDMPTLSNDAKQMVYSLLNAEEETNQQVLYLLAVGRFYAPSDNNTSTTQQYSQTSLAMQSFLSGTISQQINSLLSSVINNNNWNFGANISTGTDGFYNAEYEGLLSGKLLNNRLLINGQFGYRDNANATTSFIGDFDMKYLLFPNGNLAINVYNKTNDRYFTRNSLNTQGLGVIMKTDFTRLSDLFFWKRQKKTKK